MEDSFAHRMLVGSTSAGFEADEALRRRGRPAMGANDGREMLINRGFVGPQTAPLSADVGDLAKSKLSGDGVGPGSW